VNMNNNVPDRARLYRFFTWLYRPTTLFNLNTILAQLRDVELLHLMEDLKNKSAVTIAWAEYGRRHKLADIAFTLELKDVLEVQVRDLVLMSQLRAA